MGYVLRAAEDGQVTCSWQVAKTWKFCRLPKSTSKYSYFVFPLPCSVENSQLKLEPFGPKKSRGVIRLTDHDAIFAFPDGNTELCRGGARVVATVQRELDRRSARSVYFHRYSVDRYTCRTPHFQHVQSLHRSHSTDGMCTLAQDELCAEKHSFIHASCLFLCCTRH